jgi:hypothetical protein
MPDRYNLRSRFETEGVFWAAPSPEQKFPARLSASKNGIELATAAEVGGLENLSPHLEDKVAPDLVHGQSILGPCTLIGLHGLGGPRRLDLATGHVVFARRFRVSLCIMGLHLADESASLFSSAICSYAGLGDWLRSTTQIRLTDEAVLITHPMKTPPLLDFCVLATKTRIGLKVASNLRYSLSGRHSAGNEPRISIEPAEPTSLEWLFDAAFRFENFLSLLLGTSVRLRTGQVKTSGGGNGWLVHHERGRAEQPDVQVWVRCDVSQLAAAIAAWFSTSEEFRPLENLIYGTIRNSSMFVETEFLSLAQALESFHRLTDRTALVESSIFQLIHTKVQQTIRAVCENSALAARLEDSIQYANEPSFRNRIESLIAQLRQDHAQSLLGDPVEFEQTLRQTRNFFTHQGIRKQSKVLTGAKELFLFNQKLHALLRLLMLLHVGLPEDLVFEPVRYQSRQYRQL